jgi:predicted nuclease of predicted toxin-antitoxin system
MKILVDVNLSPLWISELAEKSIETVHCSHIGADDALDSEIFAYARNRNYVVFTHDLDFGDILAATGAASPSVIQLRSEDTAPEAMISLFVDAIDQFQSELNKGASP